MKANSEALSYLQGAARCCDLNMTYFKRSKGQTKVNIKHIWDFDVENISVKLQHDACNCLGVNVFTRQPDLDQVWKFKKLTQRSTLNSIKILMCRILLLSYNLIQAIYEELPCLQGPSRWCQLESLKRSHKGQHQTWPKFWWVEHHSLYNYNMMQTHSEAISYSQGAARCCHLNMN